MNIYSDKLLWRTVARMTVLVGGFEVLVIGAWPLVLGRREREDIEERVQWVSSLAMKRCMFPPWFRNSTQVPDTAMVTSWSSTFFASIRRREREPKPLQRKDMGGRPSRRPRGALSLRAPSCPGGHGERHDDRSQQREEHRDPAPTPRDPERAVLLARHGGLRLLWLLPVPTKKVLCPAGAGALARWSISRTARTAASARSSAISSSSDWGWCTAKPRMGRPASAAMSSSVTVASSPAKTKVLVPNEHLRYG